jgi:DNA polymerase
MTEGDFETFCEIDVTRVGAWAYSAHPSCDIIVYRYLMPGDTEPRTWLPGDPPPPWRRRILRAHNALFEACVIKHVAVPRYGWDDFEWEEFGDLFRCTLAGAAFRALPLGLEKLAQVLKAPYQKDMVGNKAMKKIAAPDKTTGERLNKEDHPDLYAQTYAYCGDDVRVEKWVGDWCGEIPAYELPVWKHDMQMQARGIKIDVELCEAAVDMAERYKATLTGRLIKATNGEVQSHTLLNALKTWLALHDCHLPNMQAETIDEEIRSRKDPEDPVRSVLEIRRYLSRSSADKYARALECLAPDGRVHGATQYYGATTGRNTGRLFQPLNLRRPVYFGEGPDEIEQLADAIKTRDIDFVEMVAGTNLMEALGDGARGMIIAGEGSEFCAGDYSAIESVITAGLANETTKLAVFEAGEDPYCWFASKVVGYEVTKKTHPKDRQRVGKPGELAFGFAGGVGAWRNFDDTDTFSDKQVEEIRDVWRDAHPRTGDMWDALDYCAKAAVLDPGEVYRYTAPDNPLASIAFVKKGDFLLMQLPSGRRLHYFHPYVKDTLMPWTNRDGDPIYKPTVHYWTSGGKHWKRVRGWRGQWTENAVQATARDLLWYGIENAEGAGYRSVLTIYDENLTENPIGHACTEEFARLLTDVKERAPFAASWPIKCDGWIGPRYHKGG